jgi:hypothetical protein
LYRADLGGAHLHGAHLRDADLCNANLRDADLRRADLRDADLRRADLRDADLRDADLCNANLRGADLRGADLRGTIFEGLRLGPTSDMTADDTGTEGRIETQMAQTRKDLSNLHTSAGIFDRKLKAFETEIDMVHERLTAMRKQWDEELLQWHHDLVERIKRLEKANK